MKPTKADREAAHQFYYSMSTTEERRWIDTGETNSFVSEVVVRLAQLLADTRLKARQSQLVSGRWADDEAPG